MWESVTTLKDVVFEVRRMLLKDGHRPDDYSLELRLSNEDWAEFMSSVQPSDLVWEMEEGESTGKITWHGFKVTRSKFRMSREALLLVDSLPRATYNLDTGESEVA